MRHYYIGLDIHKKMVAYCIKEMDGTVVDEGKVAATREALSLWAAGIGAAWTGAMEATIFTGWIYDFLKPYAAELKVGHPLKLKAIVAGKKKSDKLDARTLADLLRCNLLPEAYMASEKMRELRRVLRYRHLMVREATRMKNKISGLLMEVGAEYNKSRLRGKRYFGELLDRLEAPASVKKLLSLTRESQQVFDEHQKWLVNELKNHPEISERVQRLQSIRGVGEVTALTWVLEVIDPHRFRTIKNLVSYCGLCGGYHESAGKIRREPLSKQRNKYLQTILVEAANLAPRWNAQLADVYERELAQGADCNQASLAVARKLVAYMLYVDRTGNRFKERSAA